MAQWLRCCATNRKVSGSILAGVIVENYVLYRVKKKDNILHTKKKKTGQMYLSHPVHELPLKTHYLRTNRRGEKTRKKTYAATGCP